MENEEVIKHAEYLLKHFDNKDMPFPARVWVSDDQFAALVQGIQSNIISNRFTLVTEGVFLDGYPVERSSQREEIESTI